MSLDIAPNVEAEIEQRAAAEGVSPSQLIDRMLRVSAVNHSGDAEQRLERIREFLAEVAACPDEPEIGHVPVDTYGDALRDKFQRMGFKVS